jgi:hypothetical protein
MSHVVTNRFELRQVLIMMVCWIADNWIYHLWKFAVEIVQLGKDVVQCPPHLKCNLIYFTQQETGDLGNDRSTDTRRLSQSSNLTMGRCILNESNKVPSGS